MYFMVVWPDWTKYVWAENVVPHSYPWNAALLILLPMFYLARRRGKKTKQHTRKHDEKKCIILCYHPTQWRYFFSHIQWRYYLDSATQTTCHLLIVSGKVKMENQIAWGVLLEKWCHFNRLLRWYVSFALTDKDEVLQDGFMIHVRWNIIVLHQYALYIQG